jgi:lipid-A-disaccharide synthase
MKFYVIAGEASGDLHGANLIKAFNELEPEHEFRAWGGDLMEAEGAHVVKHYRDLAFMGFIEVIANLKTILRNIKACKEDILTHKPDAVILIDYPGFNLRIGTFCSNITFLFSIIFRPKYGPGKKDASNALSAISLSSSLFYLLKKPFMQSMGWMLNMLDILC